MPLSMGSDQRSFTPALLAPSLVRPAAAAGRQHAASPLQPGGSTNFDSQRFQDVDAITRL